MGWGIILAAMILAGCASEERKDQIRVCTNLYRACMEVKRNNAFGRDFCEGDYEECMKLGK